MNVKEDDRVRVEGKLGTVITTWRSPGSFTEGGTDFARVRLDSGDEITVKASELESLWRQLRRERYERMGISDPLDTDYGDAS
jgi:hypothetical protein